MNFISSTLICIVLIAQSSSAFANLFLCNDKHLIKIELECSGDNKIDIIDAWHILSTHKYDCGNNATTFSERRYGLTNEVMHKILMKCFYQRKCIVKHFRDEHGSNKHRGIGIEYACIPDKKVINVCNSTPKIPLTDVYLIDRIYERKEHSRCHCDLSYHGRFVVTLTHFPTEWMHLKVKTWNMASPIEKVYKDQVYKHETVYINTDTTRQQFTVINNAVNRKDELAFLLVNISATDEESNFTLQCYGPAAGPGHHSTKKQPTSTVETPSAARYAAISSIITAICLLGICASTFLIYRRFVTKKEIDSSRNNASMRSTGVVNTVERNVHASVYVDCGGRLSHSYAEIGSLSDYRHYVMPDETSQQSLKVKSRYKTLVEECYSGDSQNNDGETSHGVILNQKISQKIQGGKNNDKNCSENHRGSRPVSDAMQDLSVANTTRMFLEVKTKPRPCLRPTKEAADRRNKDKNISFPALFTEKSNKESVDYSNKMIPNEHYDPSGYLDLDVPEKTSNANLMNWKMEVYSVEQIAKAKRSDPLNKSENLNEVGKRGVTIVQKCVHDTPLEQYDYTHNREILFSEDEPAHTLADSYEYCAPNEEVRNLV